MHTILSLLTTLRLMGLRLTILRVAGLVLLSLVLLVSPAPAKAQTALGLSQDKIIITTNFSGTDLLLFGATEEASDQLIVEVRGPIREQALFRRERIGGFWLTTGRRVFASVPSYYALAANAPLDDIAEPQLLRLLQIGTDNLNLAEVIPDGEGNSTSDSQDSSQDGSQDTGQDNNQGKTTEKNTEKNTEKTTEKTTDKTTEKITDNTQARAIDRTPAIEQTVTEASQWRRALVRRLRSQGLYPPPLAITFSEARLFQVRFPIPATAQAGIYDVQVHTLRGGSIHHSSSLHFRLEKGGFEARLIGMAYNEPLLYGLLGLFLSLSLGLVGYLLGGRR